MADSLTYSPILTIPALESWAQTLQAIAAEPLSYCPDFPTIASRFEAWWRQELIDRPIFMAAANSDPTRPITRRLELIDDPDAWHAAKMKDLAQLHRVGDTLPTVRADFGAVLLGGLYGGLRESSADTAWTHPFINDDWSNVPNWTELDVENPWWQRRTTLLRRAAADAPGRYLVCTPDLGGTADALITLRGSTALALDIMDRPDEVRDAAEQIYFGWRQAFIELYRSTVEENAGMIHFFGLWSSVPYGLMACDFNALVSTQHFRDLFLPDTARQSATASRAFFHLDGPGASKQIDLLLEAPGLQAIQFTPGAGDPSALAWVDMFRKIQASGRSVLVICPADEVLDLCDALDPAGLAIQVDDVATPDQLDQLYGAFCRQYGCTV